MRVGELVRGWTRSVVSGTAGCGESGLSLGKTDVRSELSDEVEVTNLSRRVAIWSSIESISKGLVISTYVKLTTFDKVSEVTNGEVDSEQFPVKRAVTGFGWFQCLGKV